MEALENGRFDGCDLRELATVYGTPLYVMSETTIRARIREVQTAFLDNDPRTRAVFAGKAFLTLDMVRLLAEEGLGLDVVSGGELAYALRGGMDPAAIVFHGNNKTGDECRAALAAGVGTIVVDSASEFDLWAGLAADRAAPVRLLIRLNPGVDSHTHRYMSTGHNDSKFGIVPETLLAGGLLARALQTPGIEVAGFHFHVGSQLTDNRSHLLAVERLLAFVGEAGRTLGFVPEELNLGGGFGIRYEGDPPRQPLSHFTDPMLAAVRSWFDQAGLPQPLVTIEPGRFLVGEAGLTLYRVGTVKTPVTDGIATRHVAVDGGFPDNPRTALYQARYEVLPLPVCVEDGTARVVGSPLANGATTGSTTAANIAGKCCETGDILVYGAPVPDLHRGDLLAVLATGAYNHSMASNYNKIPRPPVVMVREGAHRLSVRRETVEDLLAREI